MGRMTKTKRPMDKNQSSAEVSTKKLRRHYAVLNQAHLPEDAGFQMRSNQMKQINVRRRT
ncbi:MAG: hypothetical protein J6N18_07220, partial [Kiritimatiellae bacterium]|nr:hypothetical protein [Kiritimatiellia bacterium]